MNHTCIIRSLEDADSPRTRREVGPNQALPIDAERGTVVRAETGALWLTQEGDPRDYILMPGDQYSSPTNRKIVVTSLGGAGAVTVSPAGKARGASARGARTGRYPVLEYVLNGLRALFTPSGDPALKHK